MLSTLAVAIAFSTVASMYYYWATARNKGLGLAYAIAISNGAILIWINWELGKGNTTQAVNLFSILCVWIVISGIRGLVRLRAERRM